MKSFSNEALNFFLQKVLFLLHFGSCQNCMSSANLVVEIHQKLCNKRVLSTGEPCTCEYVTLLQSFHRGTLSSIILYCVYYISYKYVYIYVFPKTSGGFQIIVALLGAHIEISTPSNKRFPSNKCRTSNAWFALGSINSSPISPHFITQNLLAGTPKVLRFKFVTQNERR